MSRFTEMPNHGPALDCSMTTGFHSERRWLAASEAERSAELLRL